MKCTILGVQSFNLSIMRPKRKMLLGLAVLLSGLSFADVQPVLADGSRAVAIFDRALRFVEQGIGSGNDVVIVLSDGYGEADAAELSSALAKSKSLNGPTRMVPIGDLTGLDPSSIKLLIVPAEDGGDLGAVTAFASANKLLVLGLKEECAAKAICTLAVETDPKTQIFISRQARTAHGVRFQSGFLVLAKEI